MVLTLGKKGSYFGKCVTLGKKITLGINGSHLEMCVTLKVTLRNTLRFQC